MPAHPLISHQRQVHLDFHTSPFIGDVGAEFDATSFARTFKEAHVNSVTVFAKCHHGQCYYPTKTGVQHPALDGRDLLGEQIEALHREGIRAPIYTTVAWEEDVADKHPDWRQLRDDGVFARCGNADPNKPAHPGGWRFNNFVHPDYQDYIEAHIREILDRYDVDGIFFDIVFFDGRSCWSDASIRFREKHGLMAKDLSTQNRFDTEAQVAFCNRFTPLIRGLRKEATIFYNSPNPINANSRAGVRRRHELQSHWELESLPSGFWGYYHFPRLARAFGDWGKPWLGMTGRFQRMWGDFGGLKPEAALEYECFRSQALGGANSVGDQLPPRGKLDAGAYDLIGAVYAQCANAEAFYEGSASFPHVGIVAPGDPGLDGHLTDLSLEGAVQMCDEAHYDAVVVDDSSELQNCKLLLLPDSVVMTDALKDKLNAYSAGGGKLIFSHRSAFDPAGLCQLEGTNLQRRGVAKIAPSYWRTKAEFSLPLSRSDRVVYLRGDNVEDGQGLEVLAERVLPYFQRTDLTFCSHAQAPPVAEADRYPAILQGRNFIYFADPIFREYRESGNIAVRDAWKEAMLRLIGPAPFGDGLPTTILVTPRRRGEDLIITLLHYVSTRKSLTVDMIEERSSFAGELLRMPAGVSCVKDVEGGQLPRTSDGAFVLPPKKGRLLLEVPGFFEGE